ncbi:hypothetical protein T4A_8970, partial [Trichinella pseudospiralis]
LFDLAFAFSAWRSRVIRFSVLFFVMDDVSELHLVPNRCGDMSLVYEGMNKLRYTGKKGCAGAIWPKVDVTSVIKQIDDIESSPVKSTMYSHWAKRYPKLPKHRRDLQISDLFRTTKGIYNGICYGLLLGTGGTVIPEPPDQQCGIFEAAFRHGVSNNKILRTLLCEGLLEDIGPSKWYKKVKCEKSRRIYDLNAVSIISLKSNPYSRTGCDGHPNLTSAIRKRYRWYLETVYAEKPAKYGIKVSNLCDAKTSYAWNMQIYTGKRTSGIREKNQGMHVVLNLTAGLKKNNVTCENFFTSHKLAMQLLKRKLMILSTIKKNKTQEHKNYWNSMYKDAPFSTGRDCKPEMILDYNATKRAVGNLDKMLASYTCEHMTARWPLVQQRLPIKLEKAPLTPQIHRRKRLPGPLTATYFAPNVQIEEQGTSKSTIKQKAFRM